MSTPTMQRPTISITDIAGTKLSVDLIEGQTLEEYFSSNAELKTPMKDETAFLDSVPMDMSEQVPASAEIVVGKMLRNG